MKSHVCRSMVTIEESKASQCYLGRCGETADQRENISPMRFEQCRDQRAPRCHCARRHQRDENRSHCLNCGYVYWAGQDHGRVAKDKENRWTAALRVKVFVEHHPILKGMLPRENLWGFLLRVARAYADQGPKWLSKLTKGTSHRGGVRLPIDSQRIHQGTS